MSSILYEGRAKMSTIEDIRAMRAEGWKKRLADGIKAAGKSQREVSLAAGLGAGYVHSILKEGKDSTVGNLIRICEAAELSVYFVIAGVQVTPREEELLKLLVEADEEVKLSVLTILRGARLPAKN